MCHKVNKILITCGGGFQGLSLLDLLNNSQSSLEIYLTDINQDNINRYNNIDNFFVSPPVSNSNKYINFLSNLVEKYQISFIIPATSIDLILLASIKHLFFEKYKTKIIVPDKDKIIQFSDKLKVIKFFENLEIPVLQNIDIQKITNENFKKLIVKPRDGSGSKGLSIIRDYDELKNFLINKNPDNYVINEYIDDFDEYSIDFSVNFDGNVSEFIIRKRIFTSLGFALITQIDHEFSNAIQNYVLTLKKHLSRKEFSGIYNVQVIYDKKNNKFYFNDLNPRIGTSACTSIYSQYNIVDNILVSNYSKLPTHKSYKIVRSIKNKIVPVEKYKVKYAIFDLDGTLVDTYKFTIKRLENIYNLVLYKKNITYKTFIESVLNLLVKQNYDILIDELSKSFGIEKTTLLNEYQKDLPDVDLYPDVHTTLNYLQSKKIELYLLTQKGNYNTHQHKLKYLPSVFKHIKIVEKKYDPINRINAFQMLLNEINIEPAYCLTVGDNLINDIVPAINANIQLNFYLLRPFNYLPNIEPHYLYIDNINIIKTLNEIKTYV